MFLKATQSFLADKTPRFLLIALFIGALDGFFGGLTGVGGGAILVTLMVSLLGLSQHKAHGTSLTVIIALAFFGAANYGRHGFVDFSIVVPIALASILGVVAGARLMTRLPSAQLRRAFGVFLMFVSLSMLSRGVIEIPGPEMDAASIGLPFWLILGVIAGVLSGFMGIGGGMVTVPAMVLVAGLPQHEAQGISLAVIPITAMVGAFTHYKLGNVEVGTAAVMAPSAIVAVIISSQIASHVDPFLLTKIFGVVLVGFSFYFAFGRRREQSQASTVQTHASSPPSSEAEPS